MRKVLSRAIAQPARATAVSTVRQGWAVTRQTSSVIGCHAATRTIRQMLEARTYVDRSALGGTTRVHQSFEACPGHDAVLDREQREQRHVDDHRRDGEAAVADAAAIDALADDMHIADHEVGVGDEPDQVQEGDHEHHIHSHAVGRDQDTTGRTAGRPR